MKKFSCLFLLIIFSSLSIFTQDEGLWPGDPMGNDDTSQEEVASPAPSETSVEPSAEEIAEAQEEEPVKTRYELRMETIRFGIQDEVIEVLESIYSEKDDSYNDALLELIMVEQSDHILEKVFLIFTDTQYEGAAVQAESILRDVINDETYNTKVVMAAMTYLAEGNFLDTADLFYDLLDEEDHALVSYALSQLGKFGSHSRSDELLDYFNENEDEDNEIAMNIIIAWGKMAYQPAVDILIELVEDEYAEKNHRQYAAVSLGQIGDPQGMEPVMNLYRNSDDAMVRAYALGGLVYFDDPQVETMLEHALTRDSFWRIRVAAAEGLGERQSQSAVELLEYKLRRDPEDHVKKAAAEALGAIGNRASSRALLDYLSESRNPEHIRMEVLKVLMKEKVNGTVDAFLTLMEEEWEKEDRLGKFLEYCCREASLIEWNDLGSAYILMLSHDNPHIQIYGIRGIRRNQLLRYYDDIRALDSPGVNGLVRREAAEL